MKESNKRIFESLDQFCAVRGLNVENAGVPRWIKTENSYEKEFIKHSKILDKIKISPLRSIAKVDFYGNKLIATIGFEGTYLEELFREQELHGGHLTTFLAEGGMRPNVQAYKVVNVIGASDPVQSKDYIGHDANDIASLFPAIRLYEIKEDRADFFQIAFNICLEEVEWASSPVGPDLVLEMRSISDWDESKIPYRILSSSLFSTDHKHLFLSLYQSIENLYSYNHIMNVRNSLNIKRDWKEVSNIIEKKLGWRPREAESLTKILELVDKEDLEKIFEIVNFQASIKEENFYRKVSEEIYNIRNSIVHYRPIQELNENNRINWEALCVIMVRIVRQIYEKVD